MFNTMAISVVQRKRELGILRALGTTRRELFAADHAEGCCSASWLGGRDRRSGCLLSPAA